MSSPTLVLLVEDDVRLAHLTAQYLEKNGFAVTTAGNGNVAMEELRRNRFDIALLDIMLPGRSGLEVCQGLRQISDLPVIILTARGEEADRVLGLELGADDYLVKPFSPRELLARMNALLRRARGQAGPAGRTLKVGDLVIDPAALSVVKAGVTLTLTSYEFGLLRALAERAGRVLSREKLQELAGGNPDEAFDRSIDVHVSRLRQKLGDDPKKPSLIKTIRGAGYMLADQSGDV